MSIDDWDGVERDEFAGRMCVALPLLVLKEEGSSFSLSGPAGLAIFMQDLDCDRRAKSETFLNFFATISLRRILVYRWHVYMSNDLVLRKAGLRQVSCIVRERQLRVYRHVARFLVVDPAHRILSYRDPRS